MCAKFRFAISSRCDDIVAEVKGGQLYAPPAAGGWRGGPAAAGLKMVTIDSQRQNVSDVSGNFQLPTIYASSNREAERRRKEQMIAANATSFALCRT